MKILPPIIYYSIFNHPITEKEIFFYSTIENEAIMKKEITTLLDKKIIEKKEDYFLFDIDSTSIDRRINGEIAAAKIMPKAKKVAKFIAKFPFIEGVSISGSLSKGYFDEESDFDFFVITQPNKVWITRFLLALYKRLFLKNSYQEFCVNYFVSTTTLEIEEKNRFTATEITTLLPLFGVQIFNDFYTKNNWVAKYYPRFDPTVKLNLIEEIEKNTFSKNIEFLFSNFVGKAIDLFLMKTITFKWRLKYKKESLKNQYKSKKGIAKHHPINFQEKIIHKLNEKYQFCKENYNIKIQKEYV